MSTDYEKKQTEPTSQEQEKHAPEQGGSAGGQFHDGASSDASMDAASIANLAANISEMANYKEKFMRLGADFTNYKRRVETERAQVVASAYSDVIAKFLPLIDDLGRAIAALGAADASAAERDVHSASFIAGVTLIAHSAKKALTDLGVTELAATGPFNPDLHEALMHVDSSDHASGEIVSVFTPGYQYKGLIIRHAQVSVAR